MTRMDGWMAEDRSSQQFAIIVNWLVFVTNSNGVPVKEEEEEEELKAEPVTVAKKMSLGHTGLCNSSF